MKSILYIFAFFVLFLYFVFVNGYCGMMLWNWFVVPVFHVPELTIYQAAGIDLLVSFWAGNAATKKTDSESQLLFAVFCYPIIVLFIGFILKTLMQQGVTV